MNTLYKIGDLKYNGKHLCNCWASLAMCRTCYALSGRSNLPQTDYFQISRDSSFEDAGEEINNVLY